MKTPNKIFIIGRNGCDWCDRAKEYARVEGIHHEYINLDDMDDDDRFIATHFIRTFLKRNKVPVILEMIGGYDDWVR